MRFSLKEEFCALIHLPTQLVTNWFVNNHSRYEKRNDTECCVIRGVPNVGFVRRRAGGDLNHDTSNHGYDGSTATYYWRADNDNNDAHRRLLIAKAGRGCVCPRHGLGGVVFVLEQQLNCNRAGRWLQSCRAQSF